MVLLLYGVCCSFVRGVERLIFIVEESRTIYSVEVRFIIYTGNVKETKANWVYVIVRKALIDSNCRNYRVVFA